MNKLDIKPQMIKGEMFCSKKCSQFQPNKFQGDTDGCALMEHEGVLGEEWEGFSPSPCVPWYQNKVRQLKMENSKRRWRKYDELKKEIFNIVKDLPDKKEELTSLLLRARGECACQFDTDGETLIKWCAVHAELRDGLDKMQIDFAIIQAAATDEDLSDGALRHVILNIVNPRPITKEAIKWANKRLKEIGADLMEKKEKCPK